MHGIFINYRREESNSQAERIRERISARLGPDRVFMDVAIPPGEQWEARIEATVGAAEVVLVVIGPRWLTIKDARGRRRLTEPDDWVRGEIEIALDRGVRLMPVLVDGASLPRARALPPSMRALSTYQAIELRSGRWDDDVRSLVAAIRALLVDQQRGAGQPERSDASNVRPPDAQHLTVAEISASMYWFQRFTVRHALPRLSALLERGEGVLAACEALDQRYKEQVLPWRHDLRQGLFVMTTGRILYIPNWSELEIRSWPLADVDTVQFVTEKTFDCKVVIVSASQPDFKLNLSTNSGVATIRLLKEVFH
jgi:hypothetical protein